MNFFIKRKEAVKKEAVLKKEADVVTNEQLYSLILSYQEDLNDIKNTLKKINKKLSMIEVSE
jgi:cell division protein YceG involved in septum cleavage